MWISRLLLTDFRNHEQLSLVLDAQPVVLAGPNGAGKTNVLEAVSLLTAGQGLRRAPYPELSRRDGPGGWAVAATLRDGNLSVAIGTGVTSSPTPSDRTGRIVRVDGQTQTGSGVLAEHVEMLWLTPAMDGLFTGAASDRRRFLDRLVLCLDPAHATRAGQFERAMRQRNRLLDDGVRDAARFRGLELLMAQTGVAMAAARAQAVTALCANIDARRLDAPNSPFPWATVELTGTLEAAVRDRPAVDVEDVYAGALEAGRERDRAAGRTLEGPHRSDLIVGHGPKSMPASACSTGEQKALLVGLVLAHAEMLTVRRNGVAPILLLDEIAAHLDERRRHALFQELLRLGTQAWLTGTDQSAFSALVNDAQFLVVEDGRIAAAA